MDPAGRYEQTSQRLLHEKDTTDNRPPEVIDNLPELLVPVEPNDMEPLLQNALLILTAEEYDQDQHGNEWKDFSEYERIADISRATFLPDLDGRAAFEVSGWTGYIECMDTGSLSETEASFEFYIYPLGDTLGTVLEGNRMHGNNRWDITSDRTGNSVHWKNHGSASTHLRHDKELNKHCWNHVAVTYRYDSNNARASIHYDGELVAHSTAQSAYELSGDEKIRIGALESVKGEQRFRSFVEPNFAISFLRIYERELSSDEVNRLYELSKEKTSMNLLIKFENWQPPEMGTRVRSGGSPAISSLINETIVTDPDNDKIFVKFARCELNYFCEAFSLSKGGVMTVEDNTYLHWKAPGLLPGYAIVNYYDSISEPVQATFPLRVQGLLPAPRVLPNSYEINETFTGTVDTVEAEDESLETGNEGFLFKQLSTEANNVIVNISEQLRVRATGEIVVNEALHSYICYSICNCTRLHDRVILTIQVEAQNPRSLPGPTESAPQHICIHIATVNQPPRFTGIVGDITVNELETFAFVYDLSSVFCDREATTLVFELGDTRSKDFVDHFKVCKNGTLLTVKPLNFEEVRSVNVTVVVSDTWKGNPQMTSETIEVYVVDIPEPPEVATNNFTVDELTTFEDGYFGKIDVADPDIYAGKFKYSSSPSDFMFSQLSSHEHLYLNESGSVFIASDHVPKASELSYYQMQFRVDDIINNVSTISTLMVNVLPLLSTTSLQTPNSTGSATQTPIRSAIGSPNPSATSSEIHTSAGNATTKSMRSAIGSPTRMSPKTPVPTGKASVSAMPSNLGEMTTLSMTPYQSPITTGSIPPSKAPKYATNMTSSDPLAMNQTVTSTAPASPKLSRNHQRERTQIPVQWPRRSVV